MRFRFTLSHEIEGQVEMSEPEGLESAIIGFERHSDFHSLVKYFRSSFRAYGSNGSQDGKRDWIKNIEYKYGIDSVIVMLVEISEDNYSFEEFFVGEFGIQTIMEILDFDHSLEFTLTQIGFWRKFISRFDVPVDIQSVNNLDNQSVPVYPSENILLPSQIIDVVGDYEGKFNEDYVKTNVPNVLIIDWDLSINDELKKFDLVTGVQDVIPIFDTVIGVFQAPENGVYKVDVKIVHSLLTFQIGSIGNITPTHWGESDLQLRARIVNNPSFVIGTDTTQTVFHPAAGPIKEYSNKYKTSEIHTSFTLLKGQQLAVYLFKAGTSGGNVTVFGSVRLNYKLQVRLATTAYITLSGEKIVDGVMTSSSRVLVKDQINEYENGIYISSAGAWSRATDTDTPAEFFNAAVLTSAEGDFYKGYMFRQVETVSNISVDPNRWIVSSFGYEYLADYDGLPVENYLRVTAKTSYPNTQSEGFLIHDIASYVMDRITDTNILYSELLGSPETIARQYPESGCYWNYVSMKGQHLRGYLLSNRQNSISFKDVWEGLDPIFNLGLGYKIIKASTDAITNGAFFNVDWYQSGSGVDWNLTGVDATITISDAENFDVSSKELTLDISSSVGLVKFDANITIISIASFLDAYLVIYVSFLDAGDSVLASYDVTETVSLGAVYNIAHEFEALNPVKKIVIKVVAQDTTSVTLYVSGFSFKVERPDSGIIEIEEKSHFYDSSSMSVLLGGVQKIKRRYSQDKYYNSVETGYSKGLTEDISGIDDYQKQTRASRFKNVGKKIVILSNWIAQSLTIEQARRETITKSADYKFDNDNFIINVKKVGSDYSPVLSEGFDSVTNLLNKETRYNKRISPSRNFLRWSNVLFNGLQSYVGSVYKFVSGVGNYKMITQMSVNTCSDNYDGEELAEDANIMVTDNHLFIPQEFEIEHYLTLPEFNTIDENRELSIGVSQTYEDYKEFFITDFQFEILSGQVKVIGYFKDEFIIQHVPPSDTITQGGKIFDSSFDYTFE